MNCSCRGSSPLQHGVHGHICRHKAVARVPTAHTLALAQFGGNEIRGDIVEQANGCCLTIEIDGVNGGAGCRLT